MKLLIVTQTVDRNDAILGFFHRWIAEFAAHAESIEVICLYEGTHTLPKHVHVHSLGKEKGTHSSFQYAFRFLSLVWKLRREYDAVLVHMNVEYVLLAGLLWRAWGKRIALWYVHGTVSLRLRLAVLLSDVVFTASPESMRVDTPKKRVVGHGIDTDFFREDAHTIRGKHLLSAGRLTTSKHHDLIIAAAQRAGRALRIVGEGPERDALERFANKIGADVTFCGAMTQEELLSEYRTAAAFVHASTTGSMDKVVLEALACACPVITTSKVYKGLPVHVVSPTPEALANALGTTIEHTDRAAVVRERFSLPVLIARLVSALSEKTS